VSSISLNAFGTTFGFASGQGSSLTFPVYPCTTANCIQVSGSASFTDGTSVSLPSQSVSVGAGETVALAWTVTPPPPAAQGSMAGAIALNGATVLQHTLQAIGPSFNQATLSADGPYTITGLNAGSYFLQAYSYFNNFNTYLYHPDPSFSTGSRFVTVSGGATTTLDVSSNAAFLSGTLRLTGTRPLSQWNSVSLNAAGISQTPASGGGAGTSPNLQNGAYSLILTEGAWAAYGLSLFWNDATSSQNLFFNDTQTFANPLTLAAGESVTRDLTYATGTVTVNYSVAGGGTLSFPNLNGNCSEIDQNGQQKSSSSFSASANQQNVAQGSVTFVAMAGTCTVDAFAQVGGSFTKFGTISVTVVPGTSQEVDIGAPALVVAFPPPDYFTSNASIEVTGTATDDVAVASVTVNGQAATLTPAAPADSVSFSATISLNLGANVIQTVATDTAAKSASDTRTIYRDESAPTLNWTPADGATSQVAAITVAGFADDDVGIQSVKVNNVEVSIRGGGIGNEAFFSVPFTLVDGPNFIEVVATDVSGKVTAQTHRITLGTADTTAPVITPNVVGTLGANGWYRSNVVVTWSVVDPESPVTSTSGCGSTTISTDTTGVTLTCTATSAGGTASNSVTIKRDTRRPRIVGLPAPHSCKLWPPNHKLVKVATVTALGGTLDLSVSSNQPTGGSPDWVIGADGSIRLRAERSGHGRDRVYTITARATDTAGNTTTRTATCVVPHDRRDHDHDHDRDHKHEDKDKHRDHDRKDRDRD
jgi:hypothetical protein